jgi:hypothetical protein
MSKVTLVLIGFVALVAALIFLAIGSSFQHSANILEHEHPSKSISHSINKGIFIDTLEIFFYDTAELNDIGRQIKIDIVPTTCWIEKSLLWKSGAIDLDSIGFQKDSINLVLLFDSYVNNQRWAPINSGQYYGKFKIGSGDSSSVYIDNHAARLDFKIATQQLLDTIRIVAKGKEIIKIKPRN